MNNINIKYDQICYADEIMIFLLLYARSILYAKHLYPTPILLRYNPFTIVLHNRFNAYPFRAAQCTHTLAC